MCSDLLCWQRCVNQPPNTMSAAKPSPCVLQNLSRSSFWLSCVLALDDVCQLPSGIQVFDPLLKAASMLGKWEYNNDGGEPSVPHAFHQRKARIHWQHASALPRLEEDCHINYAYVGGEGLGRSCTTLGTLSRDKKHQKTTVTTYRTEPSCHSMNFCEYRATMAATGLSCTSIAAGQT